MTEEDLAAIEQLMKNRVHVILSAEAWSAAMAKAMLDKIPELLKEIRQLHGERKILKLALDMDLESLKLDAQNVAKGVIEGLKV